MVIELQLGVMVSDGAGRKHLTRRHLNKCLGEVREQPSRDLGKSAPDGGDRSGKGDQKRKTRRKPGRTAECKVVVGGGAGEAGGGAEKPRETWGGVGERTYHVGP